MDTKRTESSNKNHSADHCNHPSLKKEFVLGMPTGSYICSHCGRHLSSILTASSR